MAASGASAAEMLPQLESARKLALADAQVYTQVIPGILPIIGVAAPLEVRRWGADFLAEGFASPSLAAAQKEQMVTDVLPTLKGMLDNPHEDLAIVKSAIQASASIYPLVFRRVISHPDQALIWQDMTAMKLNILRRMDNSPMSVKVNCIKFIQKVVHVQTPGHIADPRRPDRNEISIALVPRNHPLLPLPNIEAETSGLLDRLLSTLQEQSGDPIPVDATMNCLAILIRTRQAVANKILSVVLNYNPFKHAASPMTPKSMVIIKSLERTTRALLKYVHRIMPNHPMDPKVMSYLMRLQQSRMALFSESQPMKRPAEPTDSLDDVKRQKLNDQPRQFPPMPPPPNSFAQLFTLTEDPGLQQFDAKLLPVDMVSNIVGLLLQHIDLKTLDEAVNGVRQRYMHLQQTAQPSQSLVPLQGPTGIDDDDDYDPELTTGSEVAVAPATEKALEELAHPMIELGPFELPKPPPLSSTEIAILSDQTVGRVFEVAASFERIASASARQKSGLNRLAASTNDREAWITILSRLATRAPDGLNEFVISQMTPDGSVLKMEHDTDGDVESPNISNRIRSTLFHYILDDWKPRLSLAISWLTEEWYADKIRSNKSPLAQKDDVTNAELLPNYMRNLNRLLTQLLPRFDASDSKLLIRFVSELPHLNSDILNQVRQLARDPATVRMCILALQYLVMFRPPVRDLVLNCLMEIWEEGDEAVKKDVGKVLSKWRPGFEKQLTAANDEHKQEPKIEEKMEIEDDDSNKIKPAGDAVFINGIQSPSSTTTATTSNLEIQVPPTPDVRSMQGIETVVADPRRRAVA